MHGSVKSPTFVRLSSEVSAGQASLSLSAGVNGWRGGRPRSSLPGTNQRNESGYQGSGKRRRSASASGSSLSLSSGLAFAHLGGRNACRRIGVPAARWQHLTQRHHPFAESQRHARSRAAHPPRRSRHPLRVVQGPRPHDDQPARLDGGERGGHASHIGSNQIGRYSLHLHHLFGPSSASIGGYQYVLIGNAVDGGTKWGITIHNTHYGLVQDNVIYDAAGAGIMTEDGSETANVIQNNFIVRAWGTGHDRADGRAGSNDWGWEGSGIWLRGPDNYVRNNVVANANSFAVTYMMLGRRQRAGAERARRRSEPVRAHGQHDDRAAARVQRERVLRRPSRHHRLEPRRRSAARTSSTSRSAPSRTHGCGTSACSGSTATVRTA